MTRKTNASDAENLTYLFCAHWGFCDARYGDVSRFEGIDPPTFATRLLEAEGMESNPLISEWHKKITERVTQYLQDKNEGVPE